MREVKGRARMPLSLKTAVAVLAFQVLANTAVGVLLFVFAAEDIEHEGTCRR